MRVLALVSANADVRRRLATGGTLPRTEYLELATYDRVDLLDWSHLAGAQQRCLRTSSAHVRAAVRVVREYDVVFSDGEHIGIPMALALHHLRLDVPHVMIGHHLDTPAKAKAFRALRPQRRIDRILVHSRNQIDVLSRRLGVRSSRLHVVPYATDTAFWSPRAVDPEPDLVVSAGREHRDYRTLVEALPPLAHLAVADSSPFSPAATCRMPPAWPSTVVRRSLDPVALRDLYARAAVVVVPVVETTFPAGVTTLLEAMAMGKAVVASATSGLEDFLQDGVTVVPPGDAGALATALRSLLDDPDRRRALGARARAVAVEAYGIERYAAALHAQLVAATGLEPALATRSTDRSDGWR